MPIIKSAIKKQRVDKKRTVANRIISSRVKTAAKKARTQPSPVTLRELYSAVDVAVKKNVLKLNTASRIKAGIVRSVKAKLTSSPFAAEK